MDFEVVPDSCFTIKADPSKMVIYLIFPEAPWIVLNLHTAEELLKALALQLKEIKNGIQ